MTFALCILTDLLSYFTFFSLRTFLIFPFKLSSPHKKLQVDLVAGLEAGLDNVAAVSKKVNNEEDGGREEGVFGMAIMDAAKTSKSHPGQPTVVGRAAAQLYRQHPAFEPTARSKTSAAVRSGIVAGGGGGGGKQTKKALSSNSFEPATHRRVPVFGDSHNRFAPGARRRRNEDAKVSGPFLFR
jgi:hypothetical protein